jgi:tRNA (guanosine-2'-O-)-methyltransferase
MPLLARRFERLQSVLDHRMADLTVILERVEKPHNLSAILRSCDAVGALEAHAICRAGSLPTFNSTARGSQKWVPLKLHDSTEAAMAELKQRGFRLYGTHLGRAAVDYRSCDFTGPTAFVLGAEKRGLSETAASLVDQSIFIPMRGMVQSLNVSVAAAILLFEALRQRQSADLVPEHGEGLTPDQYGRLLFAWSHPQVASWCDQQGHPYPALTAEGELAESLPKDGRLPH